MGENTSLQSLPRDILTEILSHVGANNRQDLTNCIITSKELLESTNDPLIFKKLELRTLVTTPLLALHNYQDLMQKCLLHSNPSAHYVQGVIDYFEKDLPNEGLNHFLQAANGSIKEAIYLYGVINLCNGEYTLGKQYLDRLEWFHDKSVAEKCWTNIKTALHGIGVLQKPQYFISLWDMQPPFQCNLNDPQNVCPKCYYYKEMLKFIYVI